MSSITLPDRSLPINIQKDIERLETEASRQFYLHNYQESINWYNKILDLLKQTQTNINRPIHKGVPLHMIGVCYTSINEHDKALRYIMLAYIEDTLNVNFKFEDSADAAPAARMLREYYNINPKILMAVKELSRKAKSDGKWLEILDPDTILKELESKEKIDSNKLTEQLKPVSTQTKYEITYGEDYLKQIVKLLENQNKDLKDDKERQRKYFIISIVVAIIIEVVTIIFGILK